MAATDGRAMPAAGKATPARARGRFDWNAIAARYGTVAAALVIFVAFALASDRFLSVNNISNILIQISVLMIVSSGLTFAVASGEFDLSVGQVASLSGVLVAGLMIWTGLPVAVAILLSVLAGVVIGVVNGLLVTRLRIPSLIATLAMGPIALGLNYAYTNGDSIYASMPASFYYIATGKVFGVVPIPVIIALLVVVSSTSSSTRRGSDAVWWRRAPTFRRPGCPGSGSTAAASRRWHCRDLAPPWVASCSRLASARANPGPAMPICSTA